MQNTDNPFLKSPTPFPVLLQLQQTEHKMISCYVCSDMKYTEV